MPTWNRFDEAVTSERRALRATAQPHELPMADSYKAQALRELALRLETEAQLRDVQAQLAHAITRYEAAEEALRTLRDAGEEA